MFDDKHASEQHFIELNSDENFMLMISMYKEEKEVKIYATTEGIPQQRHKPINNQDQVVDESHDENDSDSVCASEESYHSRHSSDSEYDLNYDSESYTYSKHNAIMKLNSKFPTVVAFRRALNHYALTNEFEYVTEKSDLTRLTACCADKQCEWRIHASLTQDGVAFEVKKFVETHSCTQSNKCGNKHATQGWIAEVLMEKLKSDGDMSPAKVKEWLMQSYNVDVPYQRAFRGREKAYNERHGNWDESYEKLYDFKQELEQRNPGSVVEIDLQTIGDKKHFLRFFISLAACSKGFLAGCRPYVGLDACKLKGKFNGVLAAATSIDGNNGLFPVAYAVLEAENTNSWT